MKFWSWHRFGAEALLRQGRWEVAITFADSVRDTRNPGHDKISIDRFVRKCSSSRVVRKRHIFVLALVRQQARPILRSIVLWFVLIPSETNVKYSSILSRPEVAKANGLLLPKTRGSSTLPSNAPRCTALTLRRWYGRLEISAVRSP